MITMRYFSVGFALGLLLTASPIWAASAERHSGVVVSTDQNQRTITIEEMGPWHGPATAPTRRVFQITPGTRFALAERTPDGSLGWPWAYTERSLEPSDLRLGDYVTIMAEPQGTRAVALQVQTVRPAPENQ
jgi:hypothetical protein